MTKKKQTQKFIIIIASLLLWGLLMELINTFSLTEGTDDAQIEKKHEPHHS
jgi:hypothetical protein